MILPTSYISTYTVSFTFTVIETFIQPTQLADVKSKNGKKKKTDASSREDGTEGRSKLQRPNRKENIQLNCHVRSSNNHCSCSSGYIAVYRFIAMVVIEWQQLYNRCLTTQRDEIKLRLVKYLSINLL